MTVREMVWLALGVSATFTMVVLLFTLWRQSNDR